MRLRRAAIAVALVAAAVLALAPVAEAHQPVRLTAEDATPARGPLLVDGTVSFAVYADIAGTDTRGFRMGLRAGQRLEVQLLIVDHPPGARLPASSLPEVVVTDPRGTRTVLRPNERTPFLEPYSGTRYLYLARTSAPAVAGTYAVLVRSRSATPVAAVVAVGYREVPGRVVP